MKENFVFDPNMVVIVVTDGRVQKVYSGDAITKYVVIYPETPSTEIYEWPRTQFDDDMVENLLGDSAEDFMVDENEL